MIMKTLHFGIEMEMTGITRSRAASLMASFFGTESRHEGGAYDTYTARDEQGRKWKAMNDSSLVPQKKVNGNITDASSFYRTEVVSPILSYEDITKLQELVRTPNGYLQQVPQVSIAQTNLKIMLKFCEQFGLTPSARSRKIGEENGAETETDEMELLLRG